MPSVELLQWAHATVRSRAEGEAVFARWFDAQGQVSETHTFESLWQEAGRIAHELRVTWGLAKGDRAVLCYGFGLDFFAAFLGCLRAGVLAVPVYPPSPLTLSKSLAKLQGVVDACSPRVVLLSADVNRLRLASKLNFLSSARRLWPDLPYETLGSSAVSNTAGGEGGAGGGQSSSWFGYGGDAGGAGVKCFDDDSLEEDDVAFLQFTSGSTSEPKGVMVTFANLMHNATYISRKAERSFESRGFPDGERVRGFSWLPQYHDLGLIMCTLTPFVSGWRMGYMSPLDFVRRPLLWLRLLSAERAVFGCVPDFSLRLCVRKWDEATPETRASLSESVDLSALKWIQNGAEPIRASSIRDFAATFAPLGLSPAYVGTAYGLAEHVVGVCGHEANLKGLPLSDLSDEDLECVGLVDYLSEGSQLMIVDPETRREMPRGETGEVWLSSPSVTAGYWGRPDLTEEAFSARIAGEDGADSDDTTRPTFLRTGDLARVDADGRILICGRMKDLIIVRGRNLYPQDVEFAVQEACDMVRPGCVAAFSTSELGGELEVVMEVRKSAEKDAEGLLEGLEAMRRAVIAEGCYPYRLVAIKERTIPKTTSGKIQRRRSRELLHSGGLSVITELTAKVGALESTLEEQPEEPASPTPTKPTPTPSEDAPTVTDSTQTSTSTSTSSSTPVALENARAQSDNSDGFVAEHPVEEEKEMPEQPQHSKSNAVVSDVEAGEDQGGLLERQKSERVGVLTELVVSTAGEVLRGLTISPDQALFDAGFDSLTAEEFVGRLQERLVSGGWVTGGIKDAESVVSSTTVFDCPTARHMAEHMEGVLLGRVGGTAAGDAGFGGTGDDVQTRHGDGDGSLAVVGIACRFPGGCDSPEAFWDFLRKGVDATSGVPSDRWSAGEEGQGGIGDDVGQAAAVAEAKGETRGAFLGAGEAWSFDNSFFGIPPAQASCMDPQQRMMLEVGYEALHRAGFTRDSLRGSDTGIFVGACGTDWATLLAQGEGPARGPYTSTGAAASMLANRLSFTLGTVGPSMTVDTACSSSLVALRQACLHLRDGEAASNGGRSRAALVGGVNLLLSPGPFDLFSKTGMLAPDGRSKAFSADANGYGRGEGCGAVVLKRLEDARADGDRVFAIVKGSAVGHNGTSATITAPNGTAQRATISAALGEAGVAPGEVSYVEAHGTGTSLGDPVEFGALKAVYGTQRAVETPLVIGAVKSNIGHLEGAAGMSGLIKTILVLAHGAAPPNLHASEVNPRVDLSSLPAVLPREGGMTRLSRRRRRNSPSPSPSSSSSSARAPSMIDTSLVRGVGGGIGGGEEEGEGGRAVLGGAGEAGVAEMEATAVETSASTSTSTSSDFVVVDHLEDQEACPDGGETSPIPFYGGVSSFGFGGTNAHVVLAGQEGAFGKAETSGPTPGVAFLFTGQGSQYPGMGREMYEDYDEFRAVVDECDEALKDVLPRRLVSVLYGGEKDAVKLLATTRYAQPALFAVECATAAALRSKGVTPSAVMGHSLGELAAACCAGVMSLREGVRLVAERGRLMEETSEGGGASSSGADGPECMAAVRATEREASAAVESCGAGLVSLAAVNGPDSVVLSGPRRLVELVASVALSPQSPPRLPPPSLSKGDMSITAAAAASAAPNSSSSSSADGAQTVGGGARGGLGGIGGSGTGLATSNGSRYSSLTRRGAGEDGGGVVGDAGEGRGRGGVNPSGFSTRHMSWLAGAKDAVPGKGVAGLDGSESTGSVSPSCDSVERGGDGGGSDSGASSEGPLSDGALSDGPLSDGPLSDGPLSSPVVVERRSAQGFEVDGAEEEVVVTAGDRFSDQSLISGFPAPGGNTAGADPSNGHVSSNGRSRANGHKLQTPSTSSTNGSPAAVVVAGSDGSTANGASAAASLAPTPSSLSLNLPAERFRLLHGVSRAFHSPAMARSAAAVEAAAGKVSLCNPSIPLASNVTGRVAEDGELTDPSYWGKHVLQTVRFHDGLMALAGRAEGGRGKIAPGAITTFIEVGPSALLCGMGRRALQATTVREEASSGGGGAGGGKLGRFGGGGGGGAGVTPSLRWIAAMSPDERVAGKSGLGHVVGAVRGVHYRRRLFPPTESPSKLPSATRMQMGVKSETRSLPAAAAAAQRRPPLRLLETRWVCLGDAVSSGASAAAVKDGKKSTAAVAAGVVAVGSTPPSTPMGRVEVAGGKKDGGDGEDVQDDDDAAAMSLGEQAAESVWLLAGRTEASYAALRDAVSREGQSREDGQEEEQEQEQGERLCHMLTLGPSAAGGEAAAASRLKRLLRGGVGPDVNHVVYVVGGAVQAVGNEPIKGSCIDGHGDRVALQASVGEFSSLLAFVKALVWAGKSSLRPLPEAVVVTRGVHACLDGDEVEGWSMSWLPGLLRTLAVEHPQLNIRHLDLSSDSKSSPQGQQDLAPSSAREIVQLLQGEGYGDDEPEVCLRGGKLFAPRLEEGRTVAVRAAGPPCHLTDRVSPQGAYLITGGTGGLGLELALRLARAGAGGLVLLSRRGEGFVKDLKAGSPRALAWESLSRIHTTKVVVLRCDVTVADDVTNALFKAGMAGAGFPPVRGIVHAACPPQGVGAGDAGTEEDDAVLAATTTEDAEKRFMEAKVVGALNLTESAARLGLELEFLVFFSSASAVLGLAGEAGYAAANGCLDGLAWRLKRCRGLKVLSVQYGPWVESGTATDRDGAVETLRAVGHLGVENDEGFSALGFLLGGVSSTSPDAYSPPVSAVMPMEWGRYSSVFPTLPPYLGSMASKEALRGGRAGTGRGGVPWSRDEMVSMLLEAARQVTGWEGELGETLDLQEQVGMDSLQAVEFRRIICTQLGRNSIPTTLAYDCPTAGLMADELLRTVPPAAASSTSPSAPSAKQVVPRAAPAVAAVAARGVSKPLSGVSGGVEKGGVWEGEAAEAGAEWEEERHLDNSLYLFYKLLRASLAYFYMACVVMVPAWVFFWGVRQAVPLGGVGLLIFVTLPLAWLVFGLCLCLLVVGSKWLLVGRVHPGESFNTHSVRHILWWTTQRLQSFCGLLFVDEIRRGRLVVWYYRLLGARLGRDVFFNTVRISDPDLVTVGAGSTINEHADLSGHQIIGNRVVFGSGVTIGAGTVLLPSAYMAPEVQVGDGRIVGALATSMHPTKKNSTPLAPPTPLWEVALQVLADLVSLYAVAITVGLAAYAGFRSFSSMLELANIFPGEKMSALGYGPLSDSNLAFGCYAAVFLLSRLYVPVLLVFGGANAVMSLSFLQDTVLGSAGLPLTLFVTAVSAVVFHVTHMVLSVCFKWILVQRFVQVDGVCRTTSWLGFRKQITDRLIMSAMMRSVLMFNGNLGNSLWLMALGGPVGRCVSVMLNKNIYTEAELLTLGDDMHVGFASSTYCSIYTAPNTFTLRRTFIGDRSLNGAGSVTLPGATLPHGAALGPNTRLAATDAVREGALHLGSPAPVVAGRYQSPPRELSPFERALYFGAPLPLAAMSTAVTLSAAFWPLLALARAAAAMSGAGFGEEVVCVLAPLAWLGFGLSLGVTGAVAKWTIIGKQHPSDTKLWSLYHYRTLLVLYLQIHAHFLFVDILRRGRLFNTYARLLGASVGRDADVATMYFTDHDLVSIGDRAVVQEDCIPHPQFYFEGNMRFEPVSIAAGSNAGARSVLLGGATIKPNGSLETLGLAAKASSRAKGGNGSASSSKATSEAKY